MQGVLIEASVDATTQQQTSGRVAWFPDQGTQHSTIAFIYRAAAPPSPDSALDLSRPPLEGPRPIPAPPSPYPNALPSPSLSSAAIQGTTTSLPASHPSPPTRSPGGVCGVRAA